MSENNRKNNNKLEEENNNENNNVTNNIQDKLYNHKFNNFKSLDSLDINQIVKLLETESKQLKALILTFLPIHRARMVLEKFDEKEKKKILNRISQIKTVNLDVVSIIEEILEDDIRTRVKKLLTIDGKSLSKGLEEEIGEASVGRVSEKERKYLIKSLSMYHTLLSSSEIMAYKLYDKSSKNRKYIYFDTKDFYLYKNNITYSVRDREKDYFFTLKIPAESDIIERDEYNASVNKEDNTFDIAIHRNNTQLIPVKIVNDIIKNKELIVSAKFEVNTTRSRLDLDKNHSIEISIDKIMAKKSDENYKDDNKDDNKDYKKEDNIIELYELEIENKTAEDFVFYNFCDNFQKSTGLTELTYSKYQRIMNELHPNIKI